MNSGRVVHSLTSFANSSSCACGFDWANAASARKARATVRRSLIDLGCGYQVYNPGRGETGADRACWLFDDAEGIDLSDAPGRSRWIGARRWQQAVLAGPHRRHYDLVGAGRGLLAFEWN